MEDVWPRRNLGTAEHWGRVVEQRSDALGRRQVQTTQATSGLNRYTASSSEDLAQAVLTTKQIAEDVEALLASLPRYLSGSISASSYGVSNDWTTVASLAFTRPEGKTNVSVSVNAVASTHRPAGSSGPLFVWPFPLEYVTSEFGPRPPLPDHRGIDFSGGPAVLGAPIKAAADGVIIRNDYTEDDWGWYVRIGHDALTGIPNNWTGYAHLNEQSTLPVGTPVTQGQTIGYLGNSGYSFGAHLHYETAVDGTRINPRDFMSAFTGGTVTVTPDTAARIVINGVPGTTFYPYSTRGFEGVVRQIHYMTGGGQFTGPSLNILLQINGISSEIPVDTRNICSLTAFGSWT